MNASRTEKTKDTYCTPEELLEVARMMRGEPFALDPATNPFNPTKADCICVAPDLEDPGPFAYVNGLAQDWTALADGGMIWLNPPFSKKLSFLMKCADEYSRGAEIQALVPCDPATRWWQEYCSPRLSPASAVVHLTRRPVFIDPDTGKPPTDKEGKPTGSMFGCNVVYWGPEPERFREVWEFLGDVDMGYRRR